MWLFVVRVLLWCVCRACAFCACDCWVCACFLVVDHACPLHAVLCAWCVVGMFCGCWVFVLVDGT